MRRRPGLVAGTAALLVLTACGGGNQSDAVRGSAPAATIEATTSTVAGGPSPSTTASRGGATSTTTAAAGSKATTTTTAVRPAAGPGAVRPVAPGTYRYDTSGATTFAGTTRPFPAVTTLVVDPPSGTTQHSTRNLRDAAGEGPVTELTLDYRAGGVYLVALGVTVTVGGVPQGQELRPPTPVPLVATGARPGAHSEAELPGTNGARLAVDVVRDEQVPVAGKTVDTLLVKVVVTLAPGDVTGRQELDANVDPASGLWLKERSVLDASALGGLFTLHSDYTATLQRLTP